MTFCGLVQGVVILESIYGGARKIRFQASAIAPEFLIHYVLTPFFSRTSKRIAVSLILNQQAYPVVAGHSLAGHMKAVIMGTHAPLTAPFLFLWGAADIAFLALLASVTRDRDDSSSWMLIAMALWLALFSMYGALGGTYAVGERYVFPSAALMGFAVLLAVIRPATPHLRRVVAIVLLSCFLLAGIGDYFSYAIWTTFERPNAPDWATQTRQWEQDPARPIIVWPKGFGPVQLPATHSR